MEKYHLTLILLLAISSNLDNIAVGISYGTRKIGVPVYSNLLIAAITGAGTAISMLAGRSISAWLHPDSANDIGAAIIVAAGAWIFIKELFKLGKKDAPEQRRAPAGKASDGRGFFGGLSRILENPVMAHGDCSGHIGMKESVLLGIALTFNNVGGGIGAGLAGLNTVFSTFFVMLFSMVTMRIGIKAGYGYASRWLGELAGPASGLLLVVLGIRAWMLG